VKSDKSLNKPKIPFEVVFQKGFFLEMSQIYSVICKKKLLYLGEYKMRETFANLPDNGCIVAIFIASINELATSVKG
jgi:hypothetical protein